MVDIHSHILPEIDDGAPDLSESVAMARSAAASGITTIVATPHLRSDFPGVRVEELADRCERLQAAVGDAGIELGIVCGAEVSLLWAIDATDEQLRLASVAQRGTDLLIETPRAAAGSSLATLLWEVRRRGYRITLAHPERLPDFHHDRGPLAELVGQGVLLQVNAEAILGSTRRSPIAKLARRLCLDGLASAVASDAHGATIRRPITALVAAREALERLLGHPAATWLSELAPGAIVAGEPLPNAPVATHLRRPLLERLSLR